MTATACLNTLGMFAGSDQSANHSAPSNERAVYEGGERNVNPYDLTSCLCLSGVIQMENGSVKATVKVIWSGRIPKSELLEEKG